MYSASKIFVKLILKHILELQEEHNVYLIDSNWHGFKKRWDTSTLTMDLQSMIRRALDYGKFGLLFRLDLSAAFT